MKEKWLNTEVDRIPQYTNRTSRSPNQRVATWGFRCFAVYPGRQK